MVAYHFHGDLGSNPSQSEIFTMTNHINLQSYFKVQNFIENKLYITYGFLSSATRLFDSPGNGQKTSEALSVAPDLTFFVNFLVLMVYVV